ncbi:MAG TPA: holo-ACP synthase, partial [Ktedonobacterales bacterium]
EALSSERGDLASDPAPVAAIVIGVDLVERARVLRTFERFGERFLMRVFTEVEREQARGRVERLIGRFAAKEACGKALGTGLVTVAWREIEIVRLRGGKPELRLHGRAAERAAALGLVAFDVSISDTHDHAMAVVVGLHR